MFLWSLDVLLSAPCSPVIVAVPPALLDEGSASVDHPEVEVVAGGATRQASVSLALERVHTDTVVVHDAARPLAEPELIRRTVAALADADAAIAAVRVDETLKAVEGGRVVATVDREMLWRAQTPQAFRVDALRSAHALAQTEGDLATDDAMLIEKAGGSVVIVEGSTTNLKVTTPEDLLVAEALLEARR
jgi:2-C-methyl-D-erythritol 4-phosphate cytidylyltransferase